MPDSGSPEDCGSDGSDQSTWRALQIRRVATSAIGVSRKRVISHFLILLANSFRSFGKHPVVPMARTGLLNSPAVSFLRESHSRA